MQLRVEEKEAAEDAGAEDDISEPEGNTLASRMIKQEDDDNSDLTTDNDSSDDDSSSDSDSD
jgi:hypothetical protein